MKTKPTGTLCLFIFLLLMLTKQVALGQCVTPKVRTYANEQQVNAGLFTSVDDDDNAVDGNPATSSKLNVPLGVGELITVTQYLKFANSIPKNTPVTVKVSLPKGLLSLLGGVEIQPFKNLNKPLLSWQATRVGPAITGATLLGLLNGAGDMEITVTPTTEAYDGVWVRMSGIAVLQSLNVFDAYVEKDAPGTVGCSTPIDVLAGVRAGTVIGGIANATGSVTDRYAATDGNLNSAAELKVGIGVLSEVYHTTIFNTRSQPGDYVRMLIGDSGGGILKLASLSSFSIQLYNGTKPVGTAITNSSGLLSLSLFTAGDSTKQYVNIIPPDTNAFDRVEVKIGGLASVALFSSGLKIYDVKRMIAAPTTSIGGAPAITKAVCPGTTATLSVTTPQDCTIYKWYNAPTGGTLLHTGTSYTPPAGSLNPSSPNNYYVEASRSICTETSTRSLATITVNPIPAITPGANPIVCTGKTSALLPYTAPTNNPVTYSVTWDAPAISQGFSNVTDSTLPVNSIDLTVPATASPAIYTGSIVVKNANGCISSNTQVSVTVDALPPPPIINLTN